jgi:TRAP-type C4-dicarboxylate transport system substrate-binding protein
MSGKKYSVFLTFLIALLVIITGCNSNSNKSSNQVNQNGTDNASEGKKETVTLKLSSGVPAGHLFAKTSLEPFMERVTELTDGEVKFDYFPAEQLGKTSDAIDLASKGVADIAYYVVGFNPSEMPLSSSLFGIPGLFETALQGSKAYHKISQQSPMLETDFLNNGVRPLIAMTTMPYDLFTKGKEIKTPDDLKGMKIRVTGGVTTEFFNFAKAAPVQVASGDLFGSYDKGVIDAVNINAIDLQGYGLEEMTEFATRGYGFGGVGFGFVINETLYQDLPDNVKEALKQASDELVENYGKIQDENVGKVYEEKYGNKVVHDLSNDEKEKWQNLYQEFNAYWMKKQDNKNFSNIMEMFKEEVDKLK